MGKKNGRAPILVAPDGELLAELIPELLFEKIVAAGICLVVDIDGTIVDSIPMYCRFLSRRLRRQVAVEDVTRYDFRSIHQDALGMLAEAVFPNARMHARLPLIDGAQESLARIAEKEIPIIVLTARPMVAGLIGTTVGHLMRNAVPFDLLIFSRRKREIVQALKRLGCVAIVVDDDPKVATAVVRLKDVVAVLFTAYYNLRVNRRGVIRAGEHPNDSGKWLVVEEIVEAVMQKVAKEAAGS